MSTIRKLKEAKRRIEAYQEHKELTRLMKQHKQKVQQLEEIGEWCVAFRKAMRASGFTNYEPGIAGEAGQKARAAAKSILSAVKIVGHARSGRWRIGMD